MDRGIGLGEHGQHRRRGHRQQAVLAAHHAAADGHCGRVRTFDTERVQAGAAANDVGDRVERADLVKVHLLGAHTVGDGLGPGQSREDVERAGAHRVVEVGALEQAADVPPGADDVAARSAHLHLDARRARPGSLREPAARHARRRSRRPPTA